MPGPSDDLVQTLHEKCQPTDADREAARAAGGEVGIALVQVCLVRGETC